MMVLTWYVYILDVNGAFLHGQFRNGEVIYTEVPQGFHKYWDPKIWLWLLMKTCYGLKLDGCIMLEQPYGIINKLHK